VSDWKLWGTSPKERISQVEQMPEATRFYLFSTKWTNPIEGKKRKYDEFVKVWWKPNNSGYTYDLNEAGAYTREEILESKSYYSENVYPLPVERVEAGEFGKVMKSVYN
jgi:hypothetical protein